MDEVADLWEVHAAVERGVEQYGRVCRSAHPLFQFLAPAWSPPDLSSWGAVSRVAGWGRVFRGTEEFVPPVPQWRGERASITQVWLGEPLAGQADALAARYGIPVTVVATRAGLSPLASIIDAINALDR